MMKTRRAIPTQWNNGADPGTVSELPLHPVVIQAADIHEVMREQLEYLIDHAASGTCGCGQCQSYASVRSVLTKMFSDS